MAIASMQKVMIVAHRSQAAELLHPLQNAGIVQILDAERARVTFEWPELMVDFRSHRDIEESMDRITKAIVFLKPYAGKEKTTPFAPRIEVDTSTYRRVISADDGSKLLDDVESIGGKMEKLATEADGNTALLEKLLPWEALVTPVEELHRLKTSTPFVGLIAEQHFAEAQQKLTDLGAAIEAVATCRRMAACLIVCLNESASDVQKALRSFEFETVVLEGLTGTIRENIARIRTRLQKIQKEQDVLKKQACERAGEMLKLQILFDYYQNLRSRTHAESGAPATDNAVFFEGWVKKKDYSALEKLVTKFDACNLVPIEPGQDEEPPVEIDNPSYVRPFEAVTRLYGMPLPSSIDPTLFLAPFFAIFFGLCMADVGYGLVLIAVLAWALKKTQGDKKMFWMLLICGITTFLAGAITGSWFGDATASLIPPGSGLYRILEGNPELHQLGLRQKIMLFDPMTEPMTFFLLSLGLGYFQIQCGLLIGFFANLVKKDWPAALCDQLVWVIHLNCLLGVGLVAAKIIPASLLKPCGITALFTSLVILLFTIRSGAWGGRLGLGFYQLFSTVFYMGDTLSYARLMALGMVGSGFGMAINVLVKLAASAPYVGWLLGALVFVLGHSLNIALSILGAFVHTMRLQFVEFFPKFFTGGGQNFEPLRNRYRYIELKS